MSGEPSTAVCKVLGILGRLPGGGEGAPLKKAQTLCVCFLYPGAPQTPGCPRHCFLHADTVCGSLCAGVL